MISFHSCPFSLLGGDGTGGMSVYLRELSSSLTRIPGVRVDVFTRIQRPEIKGIKVISAGIRVIHLKAGPERFVDRRDLYGFLPEFTENLSQFIRQEREKYDLIYSHYWLSGLSAGWIKDRFDLPLIHIYHTLAFLKRKLLKVEREHSKRFDTEEGLASFSDAIISSSRQEKRHLVEFYGVPSAKVRVIYPGVNGKLFYPVSVPRVFKEIRHAKGDRVLLYVGRIEPIKGLMTVVEALHLLKTKNRTLFEQLKLVVIGGGRKDLDLVRNQEFLRIKEAVEKKELKGKVFFLGSKKQNQLKKYYSAAEALVVPSLYESFGLVIIEALACGSPVIVSQIGEMPSIVKERKNGFSFRPNDPLSLAACLERFFSREKKLWSPHRISQVVLRRFSWERTASETYDLFMKIVKNQTISTTIFPHGESLQPT